MSNWQQQIVKHVLFWPGLAWWKNKYIREPKAKWLRRCHRYLICFQHPNNDASAQTSKILWNCWMIIDENNKNHCQVVISTIAHNLDSATWRCPFSSHKVGTYICSNMLVCDADARCDAQHMDVNVVYNHAIQHEHLRFCLLWCGWVGWLAGWRADWLPRC